MFFTLRPIRLNNLKIILENDFKLKILRVKVISAFSETALLLLLRLGFFSTASTADSLGDDM